MKIREVSRNLSLTLRHPNRRMSRYNSSTPTIRLAVASNSSGKSIAMSCDNKFGLLHVSYNQAVDLAHGEH